MGEASTASRRKRARAFRGTAVLENGVDLTRGAEEVFDYLSDLRNEKEWNPKMELVEPLTEGPLRPGFKFRAKWKGSPVYVVEYLSYDRPTAWSSTAPSRAFSVYFAGRVTPTSAGSRLDARMVVMPHGPLRLLLPLLRRWMQRQEMDNMRFVKRKLERDG